jgi:hypothetical protein
MFELIANKSTNKELQQYYNQNREQLHNIPKEFASLITTGSQPWQNPLPLNSSPNTSEAIRAFLTSSGKTNITKLTQQELITLQDQIKAKCAQGHVLDVYGIGTYKCHSHRAGTHCQ